MFGRESQKSRGIEFIGRVDDETLLTTHQRLQRVERVHVVDGLCRLRDSERCRAPLRIDERLSHERVRTHQTRWIVARAFAARLRWLWWLSNHWTRRCRRLWREERAEVEASGTDDLRRLAVEREAERSFGRLEKDTEVGRAAENAVRRKNARDREALCAQRVDRRIADGQFACADFGGDRGVPVRTRRSTRGARCAGAVDGQRGLDERREQRLSLDVVDAVARGHGDIRADGFDHAVAYENRRRLKRLARCGNHLRAYERESRRVAWAHAVDGALLRGSAASCSGRDEDARQEREIEKGESAPSTHEAKGLR